MRTTHSPQEKVKVVGEVLQGLKTVGQIEADHSLNPDIASKWKSEAQVVREKALSLAADAKTKAPKEDDGMEYSFGEESGFAYAILSVGQICSEKDAIYSVSVCQFARSTAIFSCFRPALYPASLCVCPPALLARYCKSLLHTTLRLRRF
ncbi:MAG: hypothetical protein LBU32_00545 [Clostridiales bacterium]|jgi:hypothetical protein|nr:hypothetical protein [Clostridiales bacterium]